MNYVGFAISGCTKEKHHLFLLPSCRKYNNYLTLISGLLQLFAAKVRHERMIEKLKVIIVIILQPPKWSLCIIKYIWTNEYVCFEMNIECENSCQHTPRTRIFVKNLIAHSWKINKLQICNIKSNKWAKNTTSFWISWNIKICQ